MRIVIAPDSFKGSLTAAGAAAAMARGARSALPAAVITVIPMADGGEGTVDAMVTATGGRLVTANVTGPLGLPVLATFGLLGDGTTAVIEMAAASGLMLVPAVAQNPLVTTTFGTGELILAALDLGVTRIVLGIGGSATIDGGAGLLQALGARLLRADGTPIGRGGAALRYLDRIDLADLDPRLALGEPGPGQAELLVACDVINPLLGPQGAAAVYGPQKGATPDHVALLDQALDHFAGVIDRDLGCDVRTTPGAGAAGGLGGGLLGCLGARLRPGVELVMEAVHFDQALAGATLLLTGEGRTDGQTLAGKVPMGVALRATQHSVPTIVISGSVSPDADVLLTTGICAAISMVDGPMTLESAIAQAPELLERATARTLRLIGLGARIGQ
jgi:glycerate kinase